MSPAIEFEERRSPLPKFLFFEDAHLQIELLNIKVIKESDDTCSSVKIIFPPLDILTK